MPTPELDAASAKELLAPHLHEPIHLYICDKKLKEQIRPVLARLGFTTVQDHPVSGNYLENARKFAQLAMRESGVILLTPPRAIFGPDGKVRVAKDLPEFFANVKVIIEGARKDLMASLSKSVVVFTEIQFPQKRENTLISLSRYGVSGAFILAEQESLAKLNPNYRKIRAQEQLQERLQELRAYLADYMPHKDAALEHLLKKQEEQELSLKKAEADKLMREGHEAMERKDYERAILCFKKAIDVHPGDPLAYMESGRLYVRIRQYPRALLRFNQALEVAKSIPEPNKEIGNVRILQVRTLLAQGESIKSPAVTVLLDDALENYEAALTKAAKLPVLDPEQEQPPAVENVTAIAGEVMKLDLPSLLGKHHPAVARLGAVARKAFEQVAGEGEQEFSGREHIFLGLAAINEAQYKDAENHLFQAAEDEEFFLEACNEIIYLGTVVRKRIGPESAASLYKRLLQINPPNQGPIFFNLALASAIEKKVRDAGGYLVQALSVDPELAKNDMFYKSYQLNYVIGTTVKLFSRIKQGEISVEVPTELLKTVRLQDKLETLVLTRKDQEAFRLLFVVAAKMPVFFKQDHTLGSKHLLKFIQQSIKQIKQRNKPEEKKFCQFLEGFLMRRQRTTVSPKLILFSNHKTKALQALTTNNTPQAAFHLTKGLACYPEYIGKPDIYGSDLLITLSKDITKAIRHIDKTKL